MDRRELSRVQINGAHVKYRKLTSRSIFKPLMSREVPVFDVSKSGISFAISEKLDRGSYIQMRIHFPDQKQLRLKGQIRWLQENIGESVFKIGVQFLPFGNRSSYNPTGALNYLRQLEGQSLETRVRYVDEETKDESALQ